MSEVIYTEADIPLSREMQDKLGRDWHTLPSENDIGTVPEGAETLEDRCEKILERLPADASKALQLVSIVLIFNDSETTYRPQLAAAHIGCSAGYARQFNFNLTDGTASRRTTLSQRRREQVLSADGHECIRCGVVENLEIHHIIPHKQGGTDTRENLATLCHSCHAEAHEGAWGDVVYDSKTEFSEWLE